MVYSQPDCALLFSTEKNRRASIGLKCAAIFMDPPHEAMAPSHDPNESHASHHGQSSQIGALELDESTEGRLKYLLSVESRELRNQARQLQKEREGILAAEFNEAGAGFDGSEVCQDVG